MSNLQRPAFCPSLSHTRSVTMYLGIDNQARLVHEGRGKHGVAGSADAQHPTSKTNRERQGLVFTADGTFAIAVFLGHGHLDSISHSVASATLCLPHYDADAA
jgi:hypothetical protein